MAVIQEGKAVSEVANEDKPGYPLAPKSINSLEKVQYFLENTIEKVYSKTENSLEKVRLQRYLCTDEK